MVRQNAEKINFQAYFDDCKASEPVSQYWRPYHKLPSGSGGGCYIILADFDSSKSKHSIGGTIIRGKFALYFGKSGDNGLISRGRNYYQDCHRERLVNKLIKALWDHGVPVQFMCSQIPHSQGKGILEAMVLARLDFCCNDKDNDGFRLRASAGHTGLYDEFLFLCSRVKEQQGLQHSELFFTPVCRVDQDIQSRFQQLSRLLNVNLEEAYSAVAAAGQASASLPALLTVCSQLRSLQLTALEQLEQHNAMIDSCHDQLWRIARCKVYYNSALQPFKGRSPAVEHSEKAIKMEQEAWAERKQTFDTACKLNLHEDSAPSDVAGSTGLAKGKATRGASSTDTTKGKVDGTTGSGLFTKGKAASTEDNTPIQGGTDTRAAGLRSLQGSAKSAVARTKVTEKKATGRGMQAQSSHCQATSRADSIGSGGGRGTDKAESTTSTKDVGDVPRPRVLPTTLYHTILEDLEVKEAQAAYLKDRIKAAAKSGQPRILYRYLSTFTGLFHPEVEQYAWQLVGGTPLHPDTYMPCEYKYEYLHHIVVQLLSAAEYIDG